MGWDKEIEWRKRKKTRIISSETNMNRQIIKIHNMKAALLQSFESQLWFLESQTFLTIKAWRWTFMKEHRECYEERCMQNENTSWIYSIPDANINFFVWRTVTDPFFSLASHYFQCNTAFHETQDTKSFNGDSNEFSIENLKLFFCFRNISDVMLTMPSLFYQEIFDEPVILSTDKQSWQSLSRFSYGTFDGMFS